MGEATTRFSLPKKTPSQIPHNLSIPPQHLPTRKLCLGKVLGILISKYGKPATFGSNRMQQFGFSVWLTFVHTCTQFLMIYTVDLGMRLNDV